MCRMLIAEWTIWNRVFAVCPCWSVFKEISGQQAHCRASRAISTSPKDDSPGPRAGTVEPPYLEKRRLGSATLTVAVLVLHIIVLILAALLGLLLPGLAALLARSMLSGLSGLTALLALLPGLTTPLTLLFHIVCHELLLNRARGFPHALLIYRDQTLVAATDGKVGNDLLVPGRSALLITRRHCSR
jgi:hypothetical protein